MMIRRDPAPPDEPLGEQAVTDVTPPADKPTAPPAEPAPVERGSAIEDDEPSPPYYIATAPLFLGDQFSRAHNAGDRVPADHVNRFGWADKVRRPDEFSQQQPAAPHNEPETDPGQATSKKGAA